MGENQQLSQNYPHCRYSTEKIIPTVKNPTLVTLVTDKGGSFRIAKQNTGWGKRNQGARTLNE